MNSNKLPKRKYLIFAGLIISLLGLTSIGNVVGIPVSKPSTTNTAVGLVNAQALTAMYGIPEFDENFVWQYYFLKGVQEVPANDETTPDYYLANIVTESSVPGILLFTGGQGIARPNNDQGVVGTLNNPRNQVNARDVAQGGDVLNMGGCQDLAQTGSGFDFSRTSGFSPEMDRLTTAEEQLTKSAKYEAMFNPTIRNNRGGKKKKIKVQPKIDKSK